MPTVTDPSHLPHPTPDPVHLLNPCLNWKFDLNVPGVGRDVDCLTARTMAMQDAITTADAMADKICGLPGCKGRLIRVNRVDLQECKDVDPPPQKEAHVIANITYGCHA
jgi:hypothetical protein